MGFFDIITKPQPTMEMEKTKANTMAAIKTFAIYGAVIGFLIGILFAVFASILGAAGAVLGAGQNPIVSSIAGLGLAAIIVMPILMAILSIVGAAIGYGLYFLIAKLLGGTGTFEQNYYLGSRLLWPLLAGYILVSIIGIILTMIHPLLGMIINLAWLLYMFYLTIVLIAVANAISKLRAFVVWLIPLIILTLLFVVVLASVFAGIASLATA